MLELKIPPPLIALFCILGMYFTRDLIPSFGITEIVVWLFAGTLFIGACLIASVALFQFKKAHTTIHPNVPHKTRQVVISGVYSITRNPMYLALTMLVAAAGIAMQQSAVLLFTLACVLYLQRYQILPEERILEDKFGDEYLAYKSKTRRWM